MNPPESHQFQAEIQQLLNIVIHSLYTDKEIFVRELISNAADACEKLRFHQASGGPVHQSEVAPAITVTTDETAGTITITDTGLGMTHGELVQNPAPSRTRARRRFSSSSRRARSRTWG